MAKKQYNAHIAKAPVYTTSRGGRIVKAFDIVRSDAGRAIIHRLSDDNVNLPTKTIEGNKSKGETK